MREAPASANGRCTAVRFPNGSATELPGRTCLRADVAPLPRRSAAAPPAGSAARQLPPGPDRPSVSVAASPSTSQVSSRPRENHHRCRRRANRLATVDTRADAAPEGGAVERFATACVGAQPGDFQDKEAVPSSSSMSAETSSTSTPIVSEMMVAQFCRTRLDSSASAAL